MADRRIVQCFGVKKKPHKADKICGRRFLWTARGASGNFGSKGSQACPHCGTLPDFQHPLNRYLNGELTLEGAKDAMPEYIEKLGIA